MYILKVFISRKEISQGTYLNRQICGQKSLKHFIAKNSGFIGENAKIFQNKKLIKKTEKTVPNMY